jgi:hypothetical protein
MSAPTPAVPPGGLPQTPSLSDRIKEVARKSGRPLEVEVARSFLEWGKSPAIEETWKVWLGSYYQDGEKVRELDVLARLVHVEKDEQRSLNTTLEAVVSCKGFAEEDHPVSFSVSRGAVAEYEKPFLLEQLRPQVERSFLGQTAAKMLLYKTNLMDDRKALETRRIQGFDIYREDPKQGMRALGDHFLYEGVDSALRASFWWVRRDLPVLYRMDERLIRVLVPILVLSRPWHDIPIDDGKIGEPKETHLGFASILYPLPERSKLPSALFCLLVSRDKLKELQKALLELFFWLGDGGVDFIKNPL